MGREVGCSQMLAAVQQQNTALNSTPSQPRLSLNAIAMYGNLLYMGTCLGPDILGILGRSYEQILWADLKHLPNVETRFYYVLG